MKGVEVRLRQVIMNRLRQVKRARHAQVRHGSGKHLMVADPGVWGALVQTGLDTTTTGYTLAPQRQGTPTFGLLRKSRR
jgi:hypothetical protein